MPLLSKEKKYSPGVVSDARQLPDSDFYDHPEIAPLKAGWDRAEAEHAQAMAELAAHRQTAATYQGRLLELIAQEAEVRAGFTGLAAVDLGNADLEFTAAVDGRIRLQILAVKIEAANDVVALLVLKDAELQRQVRFAAERSESLGIQIAERMWPLRLQAAHLARC